MDPTCALRVARTLGEPCRRRTLRRCLASRALALRFVIRLTNLRFPLRDTCGCACCPHMRPMCIESSRGSPTEGGATRHVSFIGRPTTTSTPPMDPTCALRVARILGEPCRRCTLRRCLASRAPALRFVIRSTNLRFPLRDTCGCACCPHMRPMCIE